MHTHTQLCFFKEQALQTNSTCLDIMETEIFSSSFQDHPDMDKILVSSIVKQTGH